MRSTKKEISEFCGKLDLDLECLLPRFEAMRPDWTERDFCMNLMEFGRGQVSGIGEPADSDIEFYNRYLSALANMDCGSARSAAYFAGCLMGLVQLGEVAPEDFVSALELSRLCAANREGVCGIPRLGRGTANLKGRF